MLSRLAEKFLVTNWNRHELPQTIMQDQFACRPSGSTTDALTYCMHDVTLLLEANSYVRVLLVDF